MSRALCQGSRLQTTAGDRLRVTLWSEPPAAAVGSVFQGHHPGELPKAVPGGHSAILVILGRTDGGPSGRLSSRPSAAHAGDRLAPRTLWAWADGLPKRPVDLEAPRTGARRRLVEDFSCGSATRQDRPPNSLSGLLKYQFCTRPHTAARGPAQAYYLILLSLRNPISDSSSSGGGVAVGGGVLANRP